MDQRQSVFITKLKKVQMKSGGTFLAGKMGMADIVIFPHKQNEGEYNMYIQTNNYKKEQKNEQDTDEIPF